MRQHGAAAYGMLSDHDVPEFRNNIERLQKLVESRHAAWEKSMAKERQDRLKWNWDVYKFNAKHGLTRTQLNEINNPYSGFRNYSDGYQDDGGWGMSSTGNFDPMGSEYTP